MSDKKLWWIVGPMFAAAAGIYLTGVIAGFVLDQRKQSSAQQHLTLPFGAKP